MMADSNRNEKLSGYPKPEMYNQHYINKYSFPKGLTSYKKPDHLRKRDEKVSLYDMEKPSVRKGVAGWKLTRRPIPKSTHLDLQVTNSKNTS